MKKLNQAHTFKPFTRRTVSSWYKIQKWKSIIYVSQMGKGYYSGAYKISIQKGIGAIKALDMKVLL